MAVPPKTLVLVNPASGKGAASRQAKLVAELLRKRGCAAEFVESTSAADLRTCAQQARAAGFQCVAVMGGDGAVHHALQGVFGTGAALAVFPAGHGNDVAAALGLPADPVAAADLFSRCVARPVDVLRVSFLREAADELGTSGAAFCLGVAGAGLDAEAARAAETRFPGLNGAARYMAAALWSLFSFEPFPLTVELDGERVLEGAPAIVAAVASGPCYGGGIRIAPGAVMDDGEMDLTVVAPLSWARALEVVPLLLRPAGAGGELRWPEMRRFRGRRARLSTDRLVPFQAEGELLGTTPVEAELLPGAIRVFAPDQV